jgi:uncharacterized membrane protein (TIGR02234 family)
VVLFAIVGGGLLLIAASRTWVTGTVDDAVLGTSRIAGTGTQVASGLTAVALAAAAAALASTTAGRLVRRATLGVLTVAALGELALIARVLLDPAGVLGSVAARSAGRTGTIETHASLTAWPWISLGGAGLLLLAAAGGWVGARNWRGLGARYETPGASTAGARGQRVASDWDRLDAGDDPTDDRPS